MLRSLSSRGLTERGTCRQYSSISIRASYHPTRYGINQYTKSKLPLLSVQSRSYAVGPRDAVPTTKIPEKPPPVLGVKPKPKVELRPKPVKPSSLSHHPSTKPQHASTASPLKQTNESKEARPEEITPTEELSSIKQIVEKDLEVAAKHGIFAPVPEGAGFVGRSWHQIKEFAKFYYRGVTLIWWNGQEVRRIQKRIKSGGAALSRAENRFILTYQSDRLKLVPFVLMAVILEEIIPLVVIYAPGILPSTCVLPSQRERIENRRHARQRAAFVERRSVIQSLGTLGGSVSLRTLDDASASALCGLLGLSDWGLKAIKTSRISKHLRTIAQDDVLLFAERDNLSWLSDVEVAEALWERGCATAAKTPSEKRKLLTWWIDEAQKGDQQADDVVAVRVRLLSTLSSR
ncbi:hypothetical protein BD410DRAFT_764241 [Rickenella mellea]|uniref:Letm1 RBD domain-containing protein n=1 Tax=Rickenella mellea TaxID=50990 RepID=A0A4Y7QEB2_9AGAM|nr:hypothetical protein BD410DRAFT_764241 [Rickenella mellea]